MRYESIMNDGYQVDVARFVGGKLIMPAELQRIHSIVLDAAEVEIISEEMPLL